MTPNSPLTDDFGDSTAPEPAPAEYPETLVLTDAGDYGGPQ